MRRPCSVRPLTHDRPRPWRNYDEDPLPAVDGTRYTTKAQQVTDIHETARTMFEGPANWLEMYITYVTLPGNTFMANNRWWEYANAPHRQDVYSRPMLTTMGTTGLATNLNALSPLVDLFAPPSPLPPKDTVYVPYRRHDDVPGAAPKQNDGNPEGGSQAMVKWILNNAAP